MDRVKITQIVKSLKDRICLRDETDFSYPLHMAIINAYHNYSYGESENALEIIKLLLSHGADTEMESCTFCLVNIDGFIYLSMPRGDPVGLIDLAVFLKRYPFHDSTRTTLDSAIKLIVEVENRKKDVNHPKEETSHKTKSILEETFKTYKNLLFSETFSDITFLCSDGISLHAHKNILATSSNYFKTAFEGSWAETNGDGVWRTTHSSKLMIPILTLLYTGDTEQCNNLCCASDFDPLDLFEVAAEYDLQPMIPLAVNNCIDLIKSSTCRKDDTARDEHRKVPSILRAAHLHDNVKLRNACFQFVKENPVMLMDPGIITLAEEENDLWKALGDYISIGTESSGKRKRGHID